LDEGSTRFEGGDLPFDFVVDRFLDRAERVHVLDLDLSPKFGAAHGSDGNVHVTAQGTFLHIAVTNAQVADNPANFLGIFGGFLTAANVWFGDDLHQGHARPVVVHEGIAGTRETVAATMDEFPGIFFHM
jgi:hypothetical protein